MAYVSKLSPAQREQVISRVAAGATYGEISEWLLTSASISISKAGISKLVRKHRSSQADQAKVVARTHIAKRLTLDLDAFDAHMASLSELLTVAVDAAKISTSVANVEMVTKLATTFHKFHETKARAMGLEQPDDRVSDLADLLSRV